MKKLISAISVALLFSFVPVLSSSWAADTNSSRPPETVLTGLGDEAFTPPQPPALADYQGYYHNDLEGLTRFGSGLLNFGVDASGKVTSVASCASINDATCSTPGQKEYHAVLPYCSDNLQLDCISAVTATDASGNKLDVKVIGILNTDNKQDYVGDPAQGLPNGSEPTLVEIPGAPHAGGDLYLVKPFMEGEMNNNKWVVNSFVMSIYAVKVVDGYFGFNAYLTNPSSYSHINVSGAPAVPDYNQPSGCASTSFTKCAAMYPLPLDISFGLSVRITRPIVGWLHGRVTKPSISLTSEPSGNEVITVEAKAIKTPTVAIWKKNSELSPALQGFYTNHGSWDNTYEGSILSQTPPNSPFSQIAILRNSNNQHNDKTLSEFVLWSPLLGDKAQAMPTVWAVETMSNGDPNSPVAKCINQTNSLAGLVTTNAAEYVDGPPVFANNTLDYKVAATHFEKDGSTPFQGTYDLLMSSKVARCIYGFTNAPIKATISVTNDSGGSSVASTVINEANGWLTLGAYGFTYSNPTIKVKLTQDAPVVETPATATTPAATVAKKITITCVKGKTSKTVSGVKPICPSGFKKK